MSATTHLSGEMLKSVHISIQMCLQYNFGQSLGIHFIHKHEHCGDEYPGDPLLNKGYFVQPIGHLPSYHDDNMFGIDYFI